MYKAPQIQHLFWIVIPGIMLLWSPLQIPAATISGDTGDSEINQGGTTTDGGGTGTQQVASASIRVGESFTGGRDVEYVFQLPDLNGGVFTAASLTFTLNGNGPGGNGNYHIDLYGIGARASPLTLGNDYYEGANDTTDATFIQASIVNAGIGAGQITTSSSGNTNLLNYLNTQYNSGTGIGLYVFLRLNPEEATSFNGSIGYQLASADDGVAGNRPFITYTATPEPETITLLIAGGLALLGFRRRHAR